MNAFSAVFARDLRVAFRRWSELAHPLIFFVIVVALFPLALSPTTQQLREVGTGVLWVAALLSSLLALDGLFRSDADDGSLEQLLLSPVSMTITVLAKVAAHALVTLLPLVCLVPVTAWSYNMPSAALPTLALALLLATPTLSVLHRARCGADGEFAARRLDRRFARVAVDGPAADFRHARDGSQHQRRAADGTAVVLGGAWPCSPCRSGRSRSRRP